MQHADVALTDYALAVECAALVYLLSRRRVGGSGFTSWFMLFFLSAALASATGGTVHGFVPNQGSLAWWVLWPATLVMIGLAAVAAVHLGAALQMSAFRAAMINRATLVGFGLYVVTVVWICNSFLIAILCYLPAVIFLGVMFLLTYRREGKPAFLIGFLGVCVALIAAVVQQMKVDISPRYFNYNALYHVLQGIGLLMVFVTARELGGWNDGRSEGSLVLRQQNRHEIID